MKTTRTYRLDSMTITRLEELAKKYDISNTDALEQAVSLLFSVSVCEEFGDDAFYVLLPDGKKARVELKN